jgi:predicted RNA binding protein YcfA (HicA-like mRNA interferase family)
MPKLRNVSAKELTRILEKHFNCIKVRQKGSHISYVCEGENGLYEYPVIPYHKYISKGVIQTTYKKLLKIFPEEKVRKYFYTE